MLVLLGSLSITFGIHYCMGMLVASEWMVGHQDLGCGMTSMESTHHFEETAISMDCCSDEHVSFENGQLFKNQISDSSLSTPFVAALVYVVFSSNELASSAIASFDDDPPPLTGESILILNQTFLI